MHRNAKNLIWLKKQTNKQQKQTSDKCNLTTTGFVFSSHYWTVEANMCRVWCKMHIQFRKKKTEWRNHVPQTSPRLQHFCLRACISSGDWLQSFKAGISFHSTWGLWVNTNTSAQDKSWKRNTRNNDRHFHNALASVLIMFKLLKSENNGWTSFKLAPCRLGTSSCFINWQLQGKPPLELDHKGNMLQQYGGSHTMRSKTWKGGMEKETMHISKWKDILIPWIQNRKGNIPHHCFPYIPLSLSHPSLLIWASALEPQLPDKKEV